MKKLISILTVLVMSAVICLPTGLGFAETVSEADFLEVFKPANILHDSIKNSGGGLPASDSIFSVDTIYYGSTAYLGIRSTSYNPSGTSYIFGNADSSQTWKSYFSFYKDSAVGISSASTGAMKLIFKAPTNGRYTFVPVNFEDTSYFFNSSDKWTVSMYTDKETYFSDFVEAGGFAHSSFDMVLNEGETFTFQVSAPGYRNDGYQCNYNFFIGLVDEYPTQIVVEPAVYENTTVSLKDTLYSQCPETFYSSYDLNNGISVIGGASADSFTSWSKSPRKYLSDVSQTWYCNSNITGWGDRGYGVFVSESNLVFASKYHAYNSGIVFTAPFDGVYSINLGSVSKSGSGPSTLTLYNNNLVEITSTAGNTTFSELNLTMYKGESIYLIQKNTSSTSWNTAGFTFSDITISFQKLIKEAVMKEGYKYYKSPDECIDGIVPDFDAYSTHFRILNGIKNTYYVEYNKGDGVYHPAENGDGGDFVIPEILPDKTIVRIRAFVDNVFSTERYLRLDKNNDSFFEVLIGGDSAGEIVYHDICDGDLELKARGSGTHEYSFMGEDGDCSEYAEITINNIGKYPLIVDGSEITVVAYDSSLTSSSVPFKSVIASTPTGGIKVAVTDSLYSCYDYSLTPAYGGETIEKNSLSTANTTFKDISYGKYIYLAGSKKNSYSSAIYKNGGVVEYKRPGGEWSMTATFDGSSKITGDLTVGVAYPVNVSAKFAGSALTGQVYSFGYVDYSGFHLVETNKSGSFTFMPEGLGTYKLIAGVGTGSGILEKYTEWTANVTDEDFDAFSGVKLTSKVIGSENSCEEKTITATLNGAHEDENYYYRFTAVYNDYYEELISDYSLDNTAVYVPLTNRPFKIKTEVMSDNGFGMYELIDSQSVVEVDTVTITHALNKTEYFVGETLNTDGLVINVSYTGGKASETVSDFSSIVFNYDFSTAGNKTVTFDYESYTVSFDVTVKDYTYTLKSAPTQSIYYVGDTLNTAGLVIEKKADSAVVATFTDFSNITFTYDFATAGAKTVSFTFNGNNFSFGVTVNNYTYKISTKPLTDKYKVGEILDTSGLIVGKYRGEVLVSSCSDFTGITFSYDFSTKGEKTVSFVYEGANLTFTVSVSEPVLIITGGDVNGDSEVNGADVLALRKWLSTGKPAGLIIESNSEFDGVPGITENDANALMNWILNGKPTK